MAVTYRTADGPVIWGPEVLLEGLAAQVLCMCTASLEVLYLWKLLMILLQKQQYLALPPCCSSPKTTPAASPVGLFMFSLLVLWIISWYCCFSFLILGSIYEFSYPTTHTHTETHPRPYISPSVHPSIPPSLSLCSMVVSQLWRSLLVSVVWLCYCDSSLSHLIHFSFPAQLSFPMELSSPVSWERPLCLTSLILVVHSLTLVKHTIQALSGKGCQGGRFGARVWPGLSLVTLPPDWLRLRLVVIRTNCPLEFWYHCSGYLLTSLIAVEV